MLIQPELDPIKKKYHAMEPILQKVIKRIALSETDKRRSQFILDTVIPDIIEAMKTIDPLFKMLYSRILYGGSFYDGLKLNYPDEYDLDLVLRFPKTLIKHSLEVSDFGGFVRLKLNDLDSFKNQKPEGYSKMVKFLDDANYVLHDKFRDWFEGVLNKAKNLVSHDFRIRKSGPAFTVVMEVDMRVINVDLVPCFEFGPEDWPSAPFRPNSIRSKPNFLIVPKGPRGQQRNDPDWRLSFQEQERMLINGKNRMKDTIRLLKLLKSRQMQDAIASYYIKTVILWMAELILDKGFWSSHSLSYVFMMGLKYLRKLLEARTIPYYWNEQNNLLKSRKEVTLLNWSGTVQYLIKNIEKNLNDPVELEKLVFSMFGLTETPSNNIVPIENQQTEDNSCIIL